MSMTLLEMTQDILASMGSDEVNSISDTTESETVASFIRDSYNYLTTHIDLPEHYTFFELIASGDPTKPNIMTLPSNCDQLLWLRYNTEEEGLDNNNRLLEYLESNDFVERMYNLTTDANDYVESDVTINGEAFPTRYYTDRHPSFYTNIGDRTLFFDAVNLDVDATLQKSKTTAYGKLNFEFEMENTFVPNLNTKQFNLLYNEAKSQSFIELKQQSNPVSERRARKGWIRAQKTKDSVVDPYANYRNLAGYGRRGTWK